MEPKQPKARKQVPLPLRRLTIAGLPEEAGAELVQALIDLLVAASRSGRPGGKRDE